MKGKDLYFSYLLGPFHNLKMGFQPYRSQRPSTVVAVTGTAAFRSSLSLQRIDLGCSARQSRFTMCDSCTQTFVIQTHANTMLTDPKDLAAKIIKSI